MNSPKDQIKPYLGNEVLDNLLEGFQLISSDWRYLYLNDTVCKHGKYTREELLGYTMMEKYPGIEKTPMFSVLEKCMNLRVSETIENLFTFPDGSQAWFELRIEPVLEGIFILSIDITERKKVEKELEELQLELERRVLKRTQELKKANKHISILYKEMHHRIKNNLQIIASMLSLQANNTNNKELSEQLKNSKNRIQAIAQVHENLYANDRIKEVNLKDYLTELIQKIKDSLITEGNQVNFVLDCDEIIQPIDFLVPLGLLANELITNSIKHGFQGVENGEIVIKISNPGNQIIMQYEDNGCGLDAKASLEKGTLGILLIDSLSEQLGGAYELQNSGNGLHYNFRFKSISNAD